ncbi:urease accessory protein UreF [Martelella alba]
MTIPATTIMADNPGLSGSALLRLLAWLSPAFPLGGFAYSGGLEKAIDDQLLTTPGDLAPWLETALSYGFLWNDAVLLAASHRADGDAAALGDVANLAAALAGSRERYLETTALGAAFVSAASAWPAPALDALCGAVALPVAFGAIAGSHGMELVSVCQGYLQSQVSQLISAAIRLSLLGQTAGLATLAALEEPIMVAAMRAAASSLDDLGGCSFAADIATLRHETQHSRLFRS